MIFDIFVHLVLGRPWPAVYLGPLVPPQQELEGENLNLSLDGLLLTGSETSWKGLFQKLTAPPR